MIQYQCDRVVLTLLLAVALYALPGCGEDPPKNELPELVANSGTAMCEPSDNADLMGDVLVSGSVQAIDDNLQVVTVDIGGLESMSLMPDGAEPEEEDVPWTWSFTIPADRQIRCTPDLVLVFTAIDMDGEMSELSISLP